MKKTRVAIIGAGVISHRHMTIYTHIPNAEVVAVADIDANKLEKWRQRYGLDPKDCYTDFREMLKRDDIDSVDVCVHNNLHAPLSLAVMKAGKACYCEKPMAASYFDAKLMRDASKALDKKLAIQISSIMTEQCRMARSMVADGQLGKIYHARSCSAIRRRRPGLDEDQLSPEFYSRDYAGHGALFDGGVYFLSEMLFILGLPELKSVYGSAYQEMEYNPSLLKGRNFEVEEFGCGMAKFENGLSLELSIAWAMQIDNVGDSYIVGSKGGLQWSNVDFGGGDFARPIGAPMSFAGKPDLRFHGMQNGIEVDTDLRPYINGKRYELENPSVKLYHDNQVHWLAYLNGELTDETRYDTPLIAMNHALLVDGLFMSNERGESVSAEEIKATSKSTAMWKQPTPWGVFDYDSTF